MDPKMTKQHVWSTLRQCSRCVLRGFVFLFGGSLCTDENCLADTSSERLKSHENFFVNGRRKKHEIWWQHQSYMLEGIGDRSATRSMGFCRLDIFGK